MFFSDKFFCYQAPSGQGRKSVKISSHISHQRNRELILSIYIYFSQVNFSPLQYVNSPTSRRLQWFSMMIELESGTKRCSVIGRSIDNSRNRSWRSQTFDKIDCAQMSVFYPICKTITIALRQFNLFAFFQAKTGRKQGFSGGFSVSVTALSNKLCFGAPILTCHGRPHVRVACVSVCQVTLF